MRTLALAVLLAACGESVDTSGLPPIAGYQSWKAYGPYTNPVPGHGDTWRIVYANDRARAFEHEGRYPIGSVIVKEIHDLEPDGSAGSLRYLAVMRKIGDVEDRVPNDGGWLFTQIEDGDDEQWWSLCWNTCHRQGGFDGAFLDYGD